MPNDPAGSHDSLLLQAFHWERLGQVYSPPRDGGWRHEYAQVPTVLRLDDRIRVFFTTRPPRDGDGNFRSTIAWVDVSLEDPTKVLGCASEPVLPHGGPGTFDEHGLMPAWVTRVDGKIRLYYSGWMRLVGVPYTVSIGCAESTDGGQTFRKAGEGPLFGRAPREPFQENGPVVVQADGLWHMWYASGTAWRNVDNRLESIYVIKYAHSTDGLTWVRDGRQVLPGVLDHECQNRPAVINIDGLWHMWFSYRYGERFRNPERGYRLGHAWSRDLKVWNRDDHAVLAPQGGTWDSEMQCYSAVFPLGEDLFMFYNGNNFGQLGFGCAKLVR